MISFLHYLVSCIWSVLKGRYGLLLILFTIWLYRVDFMPADMGMARAIQVVTTFGMFFIVFYKWQRVVPQTLFRSNTPVSSIAFFYLFATLSCTWAFMPAFCAFLGLQNVVLVLMSFYIFKLCESFIEVERLFIVVTLSMAIFEIICDRLLFGMSLSHHFLQPASACAMCFSYCIGEFLCIKGSRKANVRKRFLFNAILVSVAILVVSTSSGANSSAVMGMGMAFLFSGRLIYASALLTAAAVLWFNKEWMDGMIMLIMPGKTQETIENATGRTELWNTILQLANQKPWFGWGFGCIERAATEYGDKASPDAHNNYIGFYGSLGIMGCIIIGYHILATVVFMFTRIRRTGFLGLLCAYSCALLNGYSYGFLSGKACCITVTFLMVVTMTYSYTHLPQYDNK